MLENYCLAFGVNAGDWESEKQWHFAGEPGEAGFVQAASGGQNFDQKLINQIRRKAIDPLLKLQNELCPRDNPLRKITAKNFTKIIFAFLDDLKVRERVGKWIDEASKAGKYEIINEHQQLFERFLDIFDELTEVFAEREMTVEDYFAIVSSAFSQLSLAGIPPSLDQVLVSSIERSRHPDLKVVFIIGATQKDFPVPIGADGILSDNDRVAAESLEFQLAPPVYQVLAERMYLAYIAFTRPSELLYITYPVLDDKGSEVIRSQFIIELESLFSDLKEKTAVDQQIGIEDILSEFELSDFLCSQLAPLENFSSYNRIFNLVISNGASQDVTNHPREYDSLIGLVQEMRVDEQLTRIGEAVASAIEYDNSAELTNEVVKELFGQLPKAVSRVLIDILHDTY
jgi:ATP-dependent helicase/nuclease subunit B